MRKVTQWDSASNLDWKIFNSSLTDALGYALGLKLVTSLPVTYGSHNLRRNG